MPQLASTAVAVLQRVGYPVVEQEVPLDPDQRSKMRVDIVAWASDETGSLAPAILVELKKSQAGSADAVLSQLARYATILGTREQYLFDGSWWRADESFTRLEAVDGPRPPRVSSDGRLNDPALVHRLLAGRLTREIESARGHDPLPHITALTSMLTCIAQSQEGLAPEWLGLTGPRALQFDREVLWQVVRSLVARTFWIRRGTGEFGMAPHLADAMVLLLNAQRPGTAIDPACGIGELLWALTKQPTNLSITGIDINPRVVAITRLVATLAPRPVIIQEGDSLRRLPGMQVDYVVCEPPFGARLRERLAVEGIRATDDIELAFIVQCASALRPGGRAVLHLSRRWLWRAGDAQNLRHVLASRHRILALIGLPGGTFPGTELESVLLVVESAPPTETLVADLAEDWIMELAEGGAFLQAFREHEDV